jgi:hypothetical protein
MTRAEKLKKSRTSLIILSAVLLAGTVSVTLHAQFEAEAHAVGTVIAKGGGTTIIAAGWIFSSEAG